MTSEEFQRRAAHAQAAWDEFIGPAIEQMRAEYMAAMSRLAANEPWEAGKITKLAIAQRVIDAVEEHLRSAITHGEYVARDRARIAKIQELPERKRRWI